MIKLIKSSFYHEAETKQKLADFVLESPVFSMGKYCAQFEHEFAVKQERKEAVFVANGSLANLILVQSLLNLGILKKGDRIGFSALTWPTNIMPLIQLGLIPVAIDCDPETLNISPKILEPHLSNIKGLFLTNVLGFADDLPSIVELCAKNNVVLFEDNCESLGSRIGDTLLGNFGIASTFSFYVGHHMSTIEGGMVVTDDTELAEMLRMVRAHGWDRNLSPETQQKWRDKTETDAFYARYTFYDLAYNVRPTEINGLLGVLQLPYLDEIILKRVSNYNKFAAAVLKNDKLQSIKTDHLKVVSNFAMPIIADTPETAEVYRKRFTDADVEIRPVIAGDMTKQPFYRKYIANTEPCPNADHIHKNGFYFGNNPELTEAEVEQLVSLLAP